MRVRLVNLSKTFSSLRGNLSAVDGLNLNIDDREFFVFLGPSGSGKSTILNLIAGLEKPTSGEVWFEDRIVASPEKRVFLPPRERNVAFVFQSYALYPHLNVFDNIAFPLRVQKARKRLVRESVQRAADVLKIFDLLMAKPRELSGGQRQRVAIARAIVRQPNLFLLDEPLSNLDPQLRLSTRRELKDLQRGLGVTTIYVTHDQTEAMSVGDRIALLNEGRLIQVGTPVELYEKPANMFAASFIGSPGMNFLKSFFSEDGGVLRLAVGDKKIIAPESRARELRRKTTRECILGIRPEHIAVNPPSAQHPFTAMITTAEPLGKETLLRVSIDDSVVSVVTNKSGFRAGDVVQIEFDTGKLHVFEPEQ